MCKKFSEYYFISALKLQTYFYVVNEQLFSRDFSLKFCTFCNHFQGSLRENDKVYGAENCHDGWSKYVL